MGIDVHVRVDVVHVQQRGVHFSFSELTGLVALSTKVDLLDSVHVAEFYGADAHCGKLESDLPADGADPENEDMAVEEFGGIDNA